MLRYFVLLSIIFLLAACQQESRSLTDPEPGLSPELPTAAAAAFDRKQAVDAVLAEHPDYPKAGDNKDIETTTGGPAPGTKVKGTLSTSVEASPEKDTYIVTLTKQWDLTVSGKKPAGYWKYKVTPLAVELIESEDSTDLVQLVK